ncbi:MAG: hypothetical protein E6772_09075 [Dysgonomonas sp.]|nr:hypothetical protein [Dysgonomonas sp.]
MKKFIYASAIIALISLVFLRCTDDIDKLKDSIGITITSPEIKSYVHFEFIDATTGKYITDQKVTVKLSGKDADQLYSKLGARSTSHNSVRGMVDFILNPKLDPNTLENNPLEILVTAESSNYAQYLKRINIHTTDENIIVRVPLVDKTNLPEGISKSESSKFAVIKDGKVQNTVVAELNSGTSTVEISEGTVLKDESGKTISGTIKSEILFYDPSSEAALMSFPGGLNVKAVTPTGNTEDISFLSAGLFDINLTSGTTKVKSFEGGSVKLTTKLDPSLTNPNTEQPIKEGDEIEMWSMDSESMIWKFEKIAKVKNINGELYLQENIDHLSYYNWDWYTPNPSCYSGARIEFVGTAPQSTITVKNFHPTNGYNDKFLVAYNPTHSRNGLYFWRVPNFPATFRFSSDNPHLKFDKSMVVIPNLCEAKTYTINVSDNRPFYNVNLDLTIVPKSGGNKKAKANSFFYVKPVDQYYWDYAIMTDGILETSVAANVEYDIAGYLNNSYGEGKLKVEDLGNQLRVTLTPDFVFDYVTDENIIGNDKKEERLIDKPKQGNTIDLEATLTLPDGIYNKLGL